MSPRLCRWTIALASRIVPRGTRAAWRARWETGLENWCALVDRGDLTMRSSGDVSRAVLSEAWCERFARIPLADIARSPAVVPVAAAAVVAGIAWLSGGFAYTRTIPQSGDRIVGHLFVLSFALIAAAVLVLFRRERQPGRGWRVYAYLSVKTALVLAAVTAGWAEGGGWLRARLPGPEFAAIVGGAGWSVAFLAAFVWAAGWCFTDESRRCPVCLRRLSSPVSIGNWSSVFEPATTELLCDRGHGVFCVADSEADPSARWTDLDASWKGL
jgi:hypothetical protein